MGDLISTLNLPDDLKRLDPAHLKKVAAEIRAYMIRTVANNGGHLAASLGVVELTLALHSNYSSPKDKIIWDVGHQCYPHKLITGRWNQFLTLRQDGGLSGFPKPSESEHDPFATGHSSTSISAALGLAQARDFKGENYKVIAVIGDGALTGGMSFEALNHAGHLKTDLLVILNDNKMSIGSNVGGMAAYLGRIRSDPKYSRMKKDFEHFAGKIPWVGKKVVNSAERIKGGLKYVIMPGMIFEELGFTYFGPVDGHNIVALKNILHQADMMNGPVLVHVVTEKGKGYSYAEQEPEVFHGIGPFDLHNGRPLKIKKGLTYTEVFGRTLTSLGRDNDKIVAITAAMTAGTGLMSFAREFPERFYDVGIAEQHGVTLAAALAAGDMRPVVAVYSTFLQRAYDQILHDTCMQNLPVVFAVDRAGISGEDGETHQGLFDLSYFRSMPNMSILTPANENELQHMLYTALDYTAGPVAIRYPRDKGEGVELDDEPYLLPWGKGELLKQGEDLLIIAAGTVVNAAMSAAEKLNLQGIDAAVINARFVKPLDEELIITWAQKCRRVITIEENVLAGGFGSGVMELFAKNNLCLPIKQLGVDDQFVEQGERSKVLSRYKLDTAGIYNAALTFAEVKAAKGSS
ncbi:MAG TPA: 1-deoxy-D-xylulose-5-phosphate synthase [Candidatus Limnocylindrales bacterium]|nr:1-deoxy-D-xylulose-5-phosphate synthase [Candidatus Limnocylindrales bacterium]